MRNSYIFIAILAIAFTACKKDNSTSPYSAVTINMGNNSSSDVYYTLSDEGVKTVERTDWDIAFSTPTMTATVLINEGAGVELYCVGDSTDWSSVNANTIASFQPLYNVKSNWSIGAFNVIADPNDMFNFGWGHYNQSDHNVHGDSIFIIKLANGDYKKLFYREKFGMTNTHELIWANLDGSDSVHVMINAASYVSDRNLIHYSITNQQVVEAEPLKNDWDLLFTRYIVKIPAGPGTFMNYPVTGVLSNKGVTVDKVTGMTPEEAFKGYTGNFSEAADAIGYDWKVSDPVTHAVSIADSVSYIVNSVDGNRYQLYFTNYGGLESGSIDIKVRKY
jgi:hypothetical protein